MPSCAAMTDEPRAERKCAPLVNEQPHVPSTLGTVFLGTEPAPVRERLGCPLGRHVEVVIDLAAVAAKRHRHRYRVRIRPDCGPPRRIRKRRAVRVGATCQPAGGEAGRSDTKGPDARRGLAPPAATSGMMRRHHAEAGESYYGARPSHRPTRSRRHRSGRRCCHRRRHRRRSAESRRQQEVPPSARAPAWARVRPQA
jgi:hypothetical protein